MEKGGLMKFNEMKDAVAEARHTLALADLATDDMVQMVVGRLRKVNTYNGKRALRKLKKELSEYNVIQQTWKS